MSSQSRLKRPGFGLPLDDMPNAPVVRGKRLRFPHAISEDFVVSGVTLREKAMLEFVNQISDKPRWWEKVHDETIVARWRSECGTEEQQRYEARCLDQKCFD